MVPGGGIRCLPDDSPSVGRESLRRSCLGCPGDESSLIDEIFELEVQAGGGSACGLGDGQEGDLVAVLECDHSACRVEGHAVGAVADRCGKPTTLHCSDI